ncbi:MAG: hypothetical protein L6Q95_14680 [Planctomycetes bacterium]|nr:hypothetical protein [Planctomycetota bacterium]
MLKFLALWAAAAVVLRVLVPVEAYPTVLTIMYVAIAAMLLLTLWAVAHLAERRRYVLAKRAELRSIVAQVDPQDMTDELRRRIMDAEDCFAEIERAWRGAPWPIRMMTDPGSLLDAVRFLFDRRTREDIDAAIADLHEDARDMRSQGHSERRVLLAIKVREVVALLAFGRQLLREIRVPRAGHGRNEDEGRS